MLTPRASAVVGPDGPLDPCVRDRERVGQRHVRQCVGRRARHRARHVADAVVDDVVDHVRRIRVRRHVRGLEAPALVDGDVDEHGARAHRAHLLGRDEVRSPRTGDEHGADHEVGREHEVLDRERARHHRLDAPAPDLVDLAQPDDVAVDDDHLRLHARGDLGGVPAGDAAAQHDDLPRRDAARAAKQHAAPAGRTLERLRALLRREPAGDLRHRREQRQMPVRRLHRLVGHGAHTPVDQEVRQPVVGGEVQVGEQDLTAAKALVLLRLRLLDLDDHVGGGEHGVGVGQDLGAGRHVLIVGDRRAHAGAGLHRPRRGRRPSARGRPPASRPPDTRGS